MQTRKHKSDKKASFYLSLVVSFFERTQFTSPLVTQEHVDKLDLTELND
jgi:hypothetical protein